MKGKHNYHCDEWNC